MSLTRVAIVVGAAVIGLAAAGAILILYDALSAPPIIIADPRLDGPIWVTVSGAVGTPGAYEVSADARVIDVVQAAGGTTGNADLGAVNLARRVHDEDKLIIPTLVPLQPTPVAGTTEAAISPNQSGPGDNPAPPSESGLVNINTATVAELDALPGIGPALAQRVIDYRTEHGPYRGVDELAKVNGISSAMVDELRPSITISE